MAQELEVTLSPERLDDGSPEERAAFGLFVIRSANRVLTEGFDHYLGGYRQGPLVSGYHAAEWLAWNWWRLRWEPRSSVPDWDMAHRMTSISEGYAWPNLAIFSDGVRTAMISNPSSRPDAKPYRYVGAPPIIVPSIAFEAALDEFVPRIIGRLRDQGVGETNLDIVWRDVLSERADQERARRRRIEALLGHDPDEGEEIAIDRLLADAARLGEAATNEVAAEAAGRLEIPTAAELEGFAMAVGREANPKDAARLAVGRPVRRGPEVSAWEVGAEAARLLREQEGFGLEPIDDGALAAMAGTSPETIFNGSVQEAPLTFVFDRSALDARIVLRSRWQTGRRFELARLIGDRVMAPGGALHPATRTYTYRQKAQRSFAAELLSPFAAVDGMLDGDYSDDAQEAVAEYFDVSPMVVNTLLKNHERIERDSADFESRP